MKKTQTYNVLLLLWLLILPFISFAYAAETLDYVGINEGKNIIWKTTFDEGPYEDFLEDAGYSEAQIEAIMDDNPVFDGEFDEDVEGWKFVILEIKNEKQYDLEDVYPGLEDDEYDGVPYLYNLYITKNFEEKTWDEKETNERAEIYKYDKDLYYEIIDGHEQVIFPLTGLFTPSMGLFYPIIAKGVNWDRLISGVDDEFADDYEDAGASKPTDTTYIIEREENGIKTFRDLGDDVGDDDIDEFGSIAIFTDDGILKYYEWVYDGDPMWLLELEESWFVANWWIIAIKAAVAVIIIIIIIVKRR